MKKLCLLALFVPFLAVSQKLENLRVVQEGTHFFIYYDIIEGFSGDNYDVTIYASYNNFSTPLRLVGGDIGKGLSDGKDKRIDWDAKTELGDYKGEISFEIQVEVIAVLAFQGKITSAKRGKSLPVTWRGGSKNQDVRVELLKAGNVESTIITTSNNGSYLWFIPPKQKTGKDYQLRLMNGGKVITTETFAVKHKIPTAVKAAPLVLLGLLALPSSSSTSDANAKNLPGPPTLTLP